MQQPTFWDPIDLRRRITNCRQNINKTLAHHQSRDQTPVAMTASLRATKHCKGSVCCSSMYLPANVFPVDISNTCPQVLSDGLNSLKDVKNALDFGSFQVDQVECQSSNFHGDFQTNRMCLFFFGGVYSSAKKDTTCRTSEIGRQNRIIYIIVFAGYGC